MKKILLIFTLIASIVYANTLGLVFAEERFTDIAGHWAEDAINKIVDKEPFAGTDGNFLPNQAITRSEFVLMLHKALGIKIEYFKAIDITEYFDDVKNEDSFAAPLYDLVTTNIIDSKEHFYPNNTLSREEMVHYIMNAYKYKMGEKYKMIKLAAKPFADGQEINVIFSSEVARAEYMGIIKRPANNKFYPKNNSTRAEAATVMDRLLTQLEKENSQVVVTPAVELKDDTYFMKLTITNHGTQKAIINHSSGQKFDFVLLDSNREVLYTWSSDKSFITVLTETKIEPGKSVEFTGEIEQSVLGDTDSKAAYLLAKIVGDSKNFTINPAGYEIEIN